MSVTDMDKSLDEIIGGKQRKSRVEKRPRPQKRAPTRDNYRDNYRSSYSAPRRAGPAILMVSNLYYTIDENDLRDLFSKIGPVSSVKLEFDRSGRSLGIAHVTYDKIEDALEAIKSFNGRKAAGQQMLVTLVNEPPVQVNLEDRISSRTKGPWKRAAPLSERLDGSRPRRSDKKNKAAGAPPRRQKLTAEEMDAELEAYMNGGNGGNSGNNDAN